jgi:hypothetical protein
MQRPLDTFQSIADTPRCGTSAPPAGIDAFAYLRDLFERISSHPQSRLAELLPDQWTTLRRATANF